MMLVATCNHGESYRDMVERVSEGYGVRTEALRLFDMAVEDGLPEDYSALNALHDSIHQISGCHKH